jgi:hypothetical protein
MPILYDQSKERYKAEMLYYVNNGRLTCIATYIQCGLGTLLNQPFNSIFELCERKHGSCPVYVRVISECYISRWTQDLEFIFRVPIRNTMIMNGQDLKKNAYEILPDSVAMPL